jgi:hypothetical protein
MKPEALRKLALAWPGAHEEPHFERTSFRVGKKIFATLAPDGLEAMIKLPVAEEAEELAASRGELFFSYGTWTTRNGALGVHLARAKRAELEPLLAAAWRSVAPKRLVAEHEAQASARPRKPAEDA